MQIWIHDNKMKKIVALNNDISDMLSYTDSSWHSYLDQATSTFDFTIPKFSNGELHEDLKLINDECFVSFYVNGSYQVFYIATLQEDDFNIQLTCNNTNLEYALEYANIYIVGSVFVLIVMGMNPFITTQGFARTSMLTTVIGAVINIVLDPILIFGLHMGVSGAALATVLSQAVSAIWILCFLLGKKTNLKLRLANMKLVPSIIGPCLALGLSSFVMVSTESILSISFTSSLARFGGDVAVGAMTVLTSLNQLVAMPLNGICQGGQPLISFNYGAKKLDRVKEAFFCQFAVCVSYTTVFWLLLMAVPQVFAGIFTSDTALVSYAAWAMRIYFAGAFSIGFQISCQQAFMALGQAKNCLLLACLRKIILLIPLIFILPNFFAHKAFAVFLAEPVSDILAAAVTVTTFFRFFHRMLKAGKTE